MKNGISLVMTILNHYKCKDCTFFRVESNIDVKTSFFFFACEERISDRDIDHRLDGC